LLGVLPGTGGLTRVTDKRHVRHDLADIFCTSVEGVRGQRAVDWRLVDAIAKPNQFQQVVRERADNWPHKAIALPLKKAWLSHPFSATCKPTGSATKTSRLK
jgi:enoyl-CoA hydratase/carnithine racemase